MGGTKRTCTAALPGTNCRNRRVASPSSFRKTAPVLVIGGPGPHSCEIRPAQVSIAVFGWSPGFSRLKPGLEPKTPLCLYCEFGLSEQYAFRHQAGAEADRHAWPRCVLIPQFV